MSKKLKKTNTNPLRIDNLYRHALPIHQYTLYTLQYTEHDQIKTNNRLYLDKMYALRVQIYKQYSSINLQPSF